MKNKKMNITIILDYEDYEIDQESRYEDYEIDQESRY